METFRSDLRIPESATPEEAAAITAAVEEYLRATGDTDESQAWYGRRWRFAGRIEALQGRSVRVSRRAPSNGWRAAGRLDRL